MLTTLGPRTATVGALSLNGLSTLSTAGVQLKQLGNLHAKIVVVHEQLTILGSANLTGRGLG